MVSPLRFGCRYGWSLRFGLVPLLIGRRRHVDEAFGVHLEDGRVMNEPVDSPRRHGLSGKI